MQTYTWGELLDRASDEGHVIALARDFLAELDPEEVASLPEACKPRKLLTAGDLGQYALDLVREHSEGYENAAPLVHRLAAFFAHANIRLSQLLAHTNDEEGDALRQSA
jgi:hypothetical protein